MRMLQDHAVEKAWFTQKPSSVVGRWRGIGFGEIVLGGIAIWAGFTIPASGLTPHRRRRDRRRYLHVQISPRRCPPDDGRRDAAGFWLAAYRRTLSKTMEQARSMDQVVKESGLEWLETPDQAVVWGVALGLAGQVEDVLGRTMADSEATGSRTGFRSALRGDMAPISRGRRRWWRRIALPVGRVPEGRRDVPPR